MEYEIRFTLWMGEVRLSRVFSISKSRALIVITNHSATHMLHIAINSSSIPTKAYNRFRFRFVMLNHAFQFPIRIHSGNLVLMHYSIVSYHVHPTHAITNMLTVVLPSASTDQKPLEFSSGTWERVYPALPFRCQRFYAFYAILARNVCIPVRNRDTTHVSTSFSILSIFRCPLVQGTPLTFASLCSAKLSTSCRDGGIFIARI